MTELRVFISSTFRDLQEEREHLVKKIFPEIRVLCRERGISFTEVDLRWGLTDEDVVLGQVVRTCLEEIDRCRPYFIGITGDRYGYVPRLQEYYKDPELLARWPWIEDAAMDGASLIDLEFRHAVLNALTPSHSTMARGAGVEVARFFFRQRLDDSLSEDVDDEEVRQLEELKQRVRSAGLSAEVFSDPVALGEMVRDDLVAIIQRDFGDARAPSPLEEERTRHAAFAASRRRAYIPNPDYLRSLNKWFTADEKPLVLYAESGSGKSSLLSFWCDQLRRRDPGARIVEHYVGIGASDTDHFGIIRHVMAEIKERFDRAEEIPATETALEQEFVNWLGYPSLESTETPAPLLIVIDGINQLAGRALDLQWLPPTMPQGIRLVISSTVEQTLVDLRHRGWTELGMQPLDEGEREAVVVRFLAEYRKALAPDLVRRIALDVKCAHPLFLRTLLEELRLFGEHERVQSHINQLLGATGTEDLFQRVLQRLEHDYSEPLVREVMCLLSCSRHGLSENDLGDLVEVGRMKLAWLLVGLDYHLVSRDGVLTFFHDYLRRAVHKRYLPTEEARGTYYERLAEHFEQSELTLRSSLELLHALERLGRREALNRVLSQIERFHILWPSEQHEVMRLWMGVDSEVTVAAYRTQLRAWEESGVGEERRDEVLEYLIELYDSLEAWNEAERIQHQRLARAIADEDRQRESRILGYLSYLSCSLQHFNQAEQTILRSEQIAREIGDRAGLMIALGNRGYLYLSLRRHDEALRCLLETEDIARELDNKQSMAKAIGTRGMIYAAERRFEEALECYAQMEQVARVIGDRRMVAVAIGYRGKVHRYRGEYEQALDCYSTYERISRETGNRRNVCAVLKDRGDVFLTIGDFRKAQEYYLDSARIANEIGERGGAAVAINGCGLAHLATKEFARALSCFHQAVHLGRDTGAQYTVAASMAFEATALLESVTETATIPEDLSPYVADVEGRTMRERLLSAARAKVEESMAVAEKTSRMDVYALGRTVLARITAADGDVPRGVESLRTLLAETDFDIEQANLHFWIWKVDRTQEEHRTDALSLYESLAQNDRQYLYVTRMEMLRDGHYDG